MKMTTEEAFVKVLQMHGIDTAFGITLDIPVTTPPASAATTDISFDSEVPVIPGYELLGRIDEERVEALRRRHSRAAQGREAEWHEAGHRH